MRWFLLILFLGLSHQLVAQEITGSVINAKTNEPLPSVNVYYAGTATGTLTDFDGNFTIRNFPNEQITLVISLMGYEKQVFTTPIAADLGVIALQEKIGDLPAIYLDPDPWSRAKKEAYFKQQFLGSTRVADKCSIRNLEQVQLQFIPSLNKMVAYCAQPIEVENKDLGYLVKVELSEFEVNFEPIPLELLSNLVINGPKDMRPTHRLISTLYVGTIFFEELEGRSPSARRRRKNRERAYERSDLKLFKSLANGTFTEKGYKLYFNKQPASFKNNVRSRKKGDLFQVDFRELEYDILDPEGYQSKLVLNGHRLLIYPSGNVSNFREFQLGGFMARLKISGTLPLEYVPKN